MATKKFKADWPAQFRFKIYVQSIALAKDAILVANSSYLRLGILRRGTKTPEEIEIPGGPVSLQLSPDGTEVAWAFSGYRSSNDEDVKPGIGIARVADGKQVALLSGIAPDAQDMCWSPDGAHFAIQAYPKTIEIWRAADVRAGKGKPRAKIAASSQGGSIAFLDASTLAHFTDEEIVRISLDGKSKAEKKPRALGDGVVVGSDGSLGYCTGVISPKGKSLWSENSEGYAQRVAFTPDASKLIAAAASWDFTYGKNSPSKRPNGMEVAFVAVHDAKTGERLAWRERPVKREVRALEVSDELVVVGRDSGCDVFLRSAL
jgi:WD40 repeat protein